MVIDNTALRTTSQATGDSGASEGKREIDCGKCGKFARYYMMSTYYGRMCFNCATGGMFRNSPIEGQEE